MVKSTNNIWSIIVILSWSWDVIHSALSLSFRKHSIFMIERISFNSILTRSWKVIFLKIELSFTYPKNSIPLNWTHSFGLVRIILAWTRIVIFTLNLGFAFTNHSSFFIIVKVKVDITGTQRSPLRLKLPSLAFSYKSSFLIITLSFI